MTKTQLGLLSVSLGIVGMVTSGYVSFSELTNRLPACSPPFQCQKVLTSQWLNLGPIPFSFLGFGFFLAVVLLGVWQVTQPELQRPAKYLWWLALAGLAFGSYTFGVMSLVLKGYCLYCLVSDGVLFAIFFVNGWYVLRSNRS